MTEAFLTPRESFTLEGSPQTLAEGKAAFLFQDFVKIIFFCSPPFNNFFSLRQLKQNGYFNIKRLFKQVRRRPWKGGRFFHRIQGRSAEAAVSCLFYDF